MSVRLDVEENQLVRVDWTEPQECPLNLPIATDFDTLKEISARGLVSRELRGA
jgi:hypothetical protein